MFGPSSAQRGVCQDAGGFSSCILHLLCSLAAGQLGETARLHAPIKPRKVGNKESCASTYACLAEENGGACFFDLTVPDRLSVDWTHKFFLTSRINVEAPMVPPISKYIRQDREGLPYGYMVSQVA
jgi:hypothetical protein